MVTTLIHINHNIINVKCQYLQSCLVSESYRAKTKLNMITDPICPWYPALVIVVLWNNETHTSKFWGVSSLQFVLLLPPSLTEMDFCCSNLHDPEIHRTVFSLDLLLPSEETKCALNKNQAKTKHQTDIMLTNISPARPNGWAFPPEKS